MKTKKRATAKRPTKARLPARVYVVRVTGSDFGHVTAWAGPCGIDAFAEYHRKRGSRVEIVPYVREQRRRSSGATAVPRKESLRALRDAAKRGEF